MKTWLLAAASFLLLALSGCRVDPEIERLERENCQYEMQNRRLRDELKDLKEQTECCPQVPQQAWRASEREPAARSERTSQPAEDATPIPPVDVMPGKQIPRGDAPFFHGPEQPGAKPPSDGGARNWLQDNARVAQITLARSLATCYDATNGSKAGNIEVVVEPRDMAGRPVAAPGDLSVVLMDAAAPPDAVPLAHWHFPAARTATMFSDGPHGGMRLDLPLASPLGNDRLRMMVRYTTRDGRRFEAQHPLESSADGPRPAGWLATPEGPTLGPARSRDDWRSEPRRLPPSDAEPARMPAGPADPLPRRPVWSPERPSD